MRLQNDIIFAAELLQLGNKGGMYQTPCTDAALFVLEVNDELLRPGNMVRMSSMRFKSGSSAP